MDPPTGVEPMRCCIYDKYIMCNICKQCGISLPTKGYKKLFCSRSCSATYNNLRRAPRSKESKQKTSSTIKKLVANNNYASRGGGHNKISEYPFTRLYGTCACNSCGRIFWKTSIGKVCCSIECRDNIRSQNKCRKTQIIYFNSNENKEVILQSTWEVKIAEWLDLNNITWTRPNKRISWYDSTLNKSRTYLPDFYLDKFLFYIDVKNPVKILEDADKIRQLQLILPLYVGTIGEVKIFVERLIGIEPTCIH